MLRLRRKPAGRRGVAEQDPADLGTAFGMEASLDDEDSGYWTVSKEPVGLEARPPEAPMSWLSRRAAAR